MKAVKKIRIVRFLNHKIGKKVNTNHIEMAAKILAETKGFKIISSRSNMWFQLQSPEGFEVEIIDSGFMFGNKYEFDIEAKFVITQEQFDTRSMYEWRALCKELGKIVNDCINIPKYKNCFQVV
jgi:hypothetical protein